VVRNRIKRRIRAAARAAELPGGWDVVVRAEPEAASIDFQKLVDALRNGLPEEARV
jgi:ribonuclease P protein component